METENFYCPRCKCETPHTVEKLLLDPNRGLRRAFLAVFSLGASEIIPDPVTEDMNLFRHYKITTTCLACGYELVVKKKENL